MLGQQHFSAVRLDIANITLDYVLSLPRVRLEEKDTLPSRSGVYFVLSNVKDYSLVYIGKTDNFKRRWRTHNLLRSLRFLVLLEIPVFVSYLELAWSAEDIELMEMCLIKKLSPLLNLKGKSTEENSLLFGASRFSRQNYLVTEPSIDTLIFVSETIKCPLENMSTLETKLIASKLGFNLPKSISKRLLISWIKSCLGDYYNFEIFDTSTHEMCSASKPARRIKKTVPQHLLNTDDADLINLSIRELKLFAAGLSVYRYSEMTKSELSDAIKQKKNQQTDPQNT